MQLGQGVADVDRNALRNDVSAAAFTIRTCHDELIQDRLFASSRKRSGGYSKYMYYLCALYIPALALVQEGDLKAQTLLPWLSSQSEPNSLSLLQSPIFLLVAFFARHDA